MSPRAAKKPLAGKLTAWDIRVALENRFTRSDGYAVIHEVGNRSGAGKIRAADTLIFDLWPTRGLKIIGVEIKVTRSDMVSELKNPRKWKAAAANCNLWKLAMPEELDISGLDLPEEWGTLRVKPDGSVANGRPGKQLLGASSEKAKIVRGGFNNPRKKDVLCSRCGDNIFLHYSYFLLAGKALCPACNKDRQTPGIPRSFAFAVFSAAVRHDRLLGIGYKKKYGSGVLYKP